MYLALSVISAGSGNTRLTLNTFVMAALRHPAVSARARAEIDAVCGMAVEGRVEMAGRIKRTGRVRRTGRTAGLRITRALHCGRAVPPIRQRDRERAPALASARPHHPPHDLTQDLAFENYFFPARTSFVINSVAVCGAVEDPEANVTDGLWQFRGGRRVCVGYRVAQMELFVAVARLVAGFDFMAVSFPSSLSSFLSSFLSSILSSM